MEESSKPTQDDFQNALAAELGVKVDPVEDEKTDIVDDKKVEDDVVDVVDDKKTDEEKAAEEAEKAEADLVAKETKEETAARHDQEAADKAAVVDDDPKFATKDDVKDAMREYNSETAGRVDKVHTAKTEIINKLYPEGIDQKIYDTNNNVINTAQDIVDRGLMNQRTNEPYTYDEAASFMLEASQKMAKNLEELQDWAEKTAEKNISLIESNERVMSKWGEVINNVLTEEQREQLAETYTTKQVKFDKTGSYIEEVAMSPEEFYDVALSGYAKLNEANTKQAELEARITQAEAAAKEAEDAAEQAERNGIPPRRGNAETKSNTGDPMLDALVEELKKP